MFTEPITITHTNFVIEITKKDNPSFQKFLTEQNFQHISVFQIFPPDKVEKKKDRHFYMRMLNNPKSKEGETECNTLLQKINAINAELRACKKTTTVT